MKISEVKITDIIQDDKNLNKGTADGKAMITKSLQKFGAGRSILLDKNNRIIAGNKTHENAEEIGMEDVIVVESDGTKLVAVKRTDIDLDSKEGREMALADNATVKFDLSRYMPPFCVGNWASITVDWNGNVLYCCNRPDMVVGHVLDNNILQKKEMMHVDMRRCERPCRLSGVNWYIEHADIEDDNMFI